MHLKRFNFVNNKWVKSQKVVNFPFKDFDPTPYLASVPQETILRHKELIEHGSAAPLTNGFLSSSSSSIDNDTSPGEMTPEHSIMSDSIKEVDTIDVDSNAINSSNDEHKIFEKKSTIAMGHHKSDTTAFGSKSNIHSSKRLSQTNAANKMRKRLVSTSLIKSPVIDGAFVDYHKHNLDEDQDPFDLKYKLYAVVVSLNVNCLIQHAND